MFKQQTDALCSLKQKITATDKPQGKTLLLHALNQKTWVEEHFAADLGRGGGGERIAQRFPNFLYFIDEVKILIKSKMPLSLMRTSINLQRNVANLTVQLQAFLVIPHQNLK